MGESFSLVWTGFFASFAAGLATGVGSLPVLIFKKISDKLLNTMLGGAAGVMLAATSFVAGLGSGDCGFRYAVWSGFSGSRRQMVTA